MERKAFKLLSEAESTWWYEGRRAVIERVLSRFVRTRTSRILDVGAGWGGMIESLGRFGEVDAFEPDPEAREACLRRGYEETMDEEGFAALAKRYDLIALFDVLEHAEDDGAMLDKLRDLLAGGGGLVITVPAFPFLWSDHDVSHHHFRRYTRASLRALLAAHGFDVAFASYWNTLLFFPAAIVRLTGKSGESSMHMPHAIDRFFLAIVRCEASLIPPLALPFGTGIVAYATKRGL